MNRREFIENAAAVGVGLPFLSFLMSACEKDELQFNPFEVNFSGKVIVIGAGTAGITAGYLLNRYNIDFEVLEASPIHGGRVRKLATFADFPIDLGAEWLHDDPSTLTEMLSDSSLTDEIEMVPYSPDSIYNWNEGRLAKLNFGSAYYSEYKFKSTTWYDFFERYMVPHMQDRIRYATAVNQIDYSGDQVIIQDTAGNTHVADRVIVTVPVTMLKNGSIAFNPALPVEKTTVLENINVPDGIKVFMEFSERFYPDMVLVGSLLGDDAQEKIYYDAAFRKESDQNIFALFNVGDSASALTSLGSDAEVMASILEELDEMFEGKASETYIRHVVQNWSREPFIQGSYSFHPDENYNESVLELLRPLGSKVFFAGEATSVNSTATVHGASETAYSVVEALLKVPN